MNRGTDFYGEAIAELIEEACRALGRPREQLDIAVLETGSTGIFGLCKKKAHIRVQVKPEARGLKAEKPTARKADAPAPLVAEAEAGRKKRQAKLEKPAPEAPVRVEQETAGDGAPSAELLALVEDRLTGLLSRMGMPSTVRVSYTDGVVLCGISGEHEAYLAGQDGKILENLQYLLRKMLGEKLPERVILSLDAGGYRKQRLARLRRQATELAAQVLADGKTRSLPGLNPAERQAVHLTLQQAGEVRSRSVGSGLFKKVLIYKSGKEDAAEAGQTEAPAPADKHRGRSGGRRRD